MTNLVTVLGPMMFLECAKDVCHLLTRLQCQLFADDMQGLKHGLTTEVTEIVSTLANCTADIIAWCTTKHLQLNADKMEVIWFCMAAKLNTISLAGTDIH